MIDKRLAKMCHFFEEHMLHEAACAGELAEAKWLIRS